MGLSEPRKRMKLSHDPNNTKWTRDTGGFGHKIMTAQGWQPGEYLGVKEASHAEFHTAANASHIRVFVKDDNLGLGAKKGSGLAEGECTGLFAFQALLGRLNGKDDDELQKEQKSREDLKRAIYSERKWGSVRFVKGGFLIGDKIQKLIDEEAERIRLITEGNSSTGADTSAEEDLLSAKKPKKRRTKKETEMIVLEEVQQATDDASKFVRSKNKDFKPNSEKKAKSSLEVKDPVEENLAKKKRKKDRRESRKNGADGGAIVVAEVPGKRKEKSKPASDEDDANGAEPPLPISSKSPSTTPDSRPPTPRHFVGNRHAVRSRFIAHKKLAHVDNAALDQIFMIKRP